MSNEIRVFVMTDSNSGITPEEGKQYGIGVIPMPVYVNGEEYFEGISLSREAFFSMLTAHADVSTSQPLPGQLTDAWDEALKDYPQVLYIPMSGALSSSVRTASLLAQDYDGRVEVVDNHRISCTQKQSALEALQLARLGWDARSIRELLEKRALEASIYIALDTLDYLKRGGRVTPAAAAISSALNLKPVLQIQGGRLDAFARVRGKKAAKAKLLEAADADLSGRFQGQDVMICGAYSCTPEEAQLWLEQLRGHYSDAPDLALDPLPLSICCHTGPGSVAVICIPRLPDCPSPLS